MTDTPRADALLTALISGTPQIEAFATLTEAHEREKALYVLLALLTDPNPRLQQRATRALGVLGDQWAVPALLEAFERSNIEITTIFDALLELGNPAAILPLLMYSGATFEQQKRVIARFAPSDLQREMGKGVNHPEPSLRSRVLSALIHFINPWSINVLIMSLNDPDEHIRGLSVYLLGQMRIPSVVPFLLPHTKDSHPPVRQLTAAALGELGDPQAIPALLPLLEDAEMTIRVYAAIALAALGDGTGVPLLKRVGERDNEMLRIAARQAIDHINSQKG